MVYLMKNDSHGEYKIHRAELLCALKCTLWQNRKSTNQFYMVVIYTATFDEME